MTGRRPPDLFADAASHRPLLRLTGSFACNPATVRQAGFRGIIFAPEAAALDCARQCFAERLEVWADVSSVIAPRDELKKQQLRFSDLQPRIEAAGDELDTLHPESWAVVTALLSPLEKFLAGVTLEILPPVSTSPLPPFPWTGTLPQAFQQRHGFNLLNRIETLVSSSGDEASRIRQQYWLEVDALHERNYLEPIRRWCEQRSVTCSTRCMQPEWRAFSLSPKLQVRLDVAANELNRAPAFPTSLDVQNGFRELNCLALAGAGAFERHHSPNLGLPPELQRNAVIARTAAALTAANSASKVGVLFPGRSAQTHYHPDGHRFTRWVGDDLQLVTNLLDDLHYDWLFMQEDELVDGVCDTSTLHAGACKHCFEMIVVPSVTALSWEAWEKLEQFAEGGGKLACLGLLPRWSERGRDRALENLIGKAARVVIEDLYQAYAALEGDGPMPPTIGYPVFREYYSGGRLCCYQPRLNADAEDARLRVRQILHESLAPVFETLSPSIRYTHRVHPGGDLFLIANEGDQTATVNTHLRPVHEGTPHELDAATGEVKPVYVAMPYPLDAGGGKGLSFELAAGQARLVEFVANQTRDKHRLLERATFEVSDFDGETASGYKKQNGVAEVALRQNNRIQWYGGDDVKIPAPLLFDSDDWNEESSDLQQEYSQSVTVPTEWKNCRVFLEVSQPPGPVQCFVNGGDASLRLAAPFRFDVSLLLALGASNDFIIRVWSAQREYSPLVRLVAYPQVAVKITL